MHVCMHAQVHAYDPGTSTHLLWRQGGLEDELCALDDIDDAQAHLHLRQGLEAHADLITDRHGGVLLLEPRHIYLEVVAVRGDIPGVRVLSEGEGVE